LVKIKNGASLPVKNGQAQRSKKMNAPEGEYAEIVRKVKNGLAVIVGEANFLLKRETLTEQGENQLEDIKKQVSRIEGLLEKIK